MQWLTEKQISLVSLGINKVKTWQIQLSAAKGLNQWLTLNSKEPQVGPFLRWEQKQLTSSQKHLTTTTTHPCIPELLQGPVVCGAVLGILHFHRNHRAWEGTRFTVMGPSRVRGQKFRGQRWVEGVRQQYKLELNLFRKNNNNNKKLLMDSNWLFGSLITCLLACCVIHAAFTQIYCSQHQILPQQLWKFLSHSPIFNCLWITKCKQAKVDW